MSLKDKTVLVSGGRRGIGLAIATRLAGEGASVVLDDAGENFVSARISLAAVGPTPLLADLAGDALAGQPVSDDSIREAAGTARAIASR